MADEPKKPEEIIPGDKTERSIPPKETDLISPEAEKVMDDLEDEGFEIEQDPRKKKAKGTESKEPEAPEPSKEPEKDKKPEAPKKKPEKESDEEPEAKEPDKEPEKEPEKKEDKEPPPKKRTPKFMPSWQHEVAMKKKEKEHAEAIEGVNKKLSDALEGTAPPTPKPEDTKQEKEEAEKKLGVLSERLDISKGDLQEIIDLARQGVTPDLPKDIRDKLALLDKIPNLEDALKGVDADKAALEEEKEFSKDFKDNIASLVKEEYPNATDDQLETVRESLQQIAFTEAYASVPLAEIYRGRSEFRGLFPDKKSGEPGSKGRKTEGEIDDEDVSEEDFAKMSPDDRIKFSKRQVAKEKKI